MKDLSIIISTWNNSKQLRKTLEALTQCSVPKDFSYEIVVVNNNCTDDTDKVVFDFREKLPLNYVKEPIQGLSRARNAGIRASKGTLLLFTDDDVRPSENWIQLFWQAYQKQPNGHFFGGPIESEFESHDFDKELLAYAPHSVKGLDWGDEERPLKRMEYFISANWACSKDIILLCGAFDENKGLNSKGSRMSVGEEIDLMNKIRHRGLVPLYLPTATLKHFVPISKTKLYHIAQREKAVGFDGARHELNNYNGSFLLGVPRWMYKQASTSYLQWIFKRITGRKAYEEYLSFQRLIGKMHGIYEIQNDNQKGKHKKILWVITLLILVSLFVLTIGQIS